MSLSIDITVRRGELLLDIALEVADGETVAVVGPNGAGKSTLLEAVAGLVTIDRGEISRDGLVFDRGDAATRLPPAEREIGVVFQDLRLFPALSVLDNVAFGWRARGASRKEARARALPWLDGVGLADCAKLAPSKLSGGQAQRVALARALAIAPRVLLLDEPMAAVDARAKVELRRLIRRHLESFPGSRLLVAHDIEDAVALADRIAVLEGGRLVQIGSVADVVARPASAFASDLVGLNFYTGLGREGRVRVGERELVTASSMVGEVAVTIHPRAVSLFTERPKGSPRNSWPAEVIGLDPSLGRFRVRLGGDLPIVAEVTPAAIRELALEPGRVLWVTIKATEIGVAAR